MQSAKPMADVTNLHLNFPQQASPAGRQREVAPTKVVVDSVFFTRIISLPHNGHRLFLQI